MNEEQNFSMLTEVIKCCQKAQIALSKDRDLFTVEVVKARGFLEFVFADLKNKIENKTVIFGTSSLEPYKDVPYIAEVYDKIVVENKDADV